MNQVQAGNLNTRDLDVVRSLCADTGRRGLRLLLPSFAYCAAGGLGLLVGICGVGLRATAEQLGLLLAAAA
ncbi:hypothetical protein PC128_g22874 [Phytophthora cactorum]|nr:hypothetical protein PC128_g22874 [Phytophthora cactorum]